MNYVKCPRCGEPEHPDNCTIPANPDGPKYATVVDGCVVHGDAPLSPASREVVSEIIEAVREMMSDKPNGWVAKNNPAEVTPINDLRDHTSGSSCWCKPFSDDGVIVHNALDGRERLERSDVKRQ